MDYKQIGVYKERQLKEKLEKLEEELEQEKAGREFSEEQSTKTINELNEENKRLRTLLYNSLDLLKTNSGIDDVDLSIEDTDLLDELGMTIEEYDDIIGE